jgi:hypothetical protein
MNAGTFWRGLLLAVLLSTAGALVFALVAPSAGAGPTLRWVVLLVASMWMLEQLRHLRAGRLLLGSGWALLCIALLLTEPPLALWLALPALALWLGRRLLQSRRLSATALDATLGVLAVVASLVALRHTGSIWLALWCFLLPQALTASLTYPRSTATDPAARFDAARHAAERALHALDRTPFPR